MHNIAVSVIIPVYNAGIYLAECIRSVQEQTLANIEIIIVNDGSTDGSHGIISSLAAADPRIVYVNGENEGVSAARNKGIRLAKGEFVGFVDADDWIEDSMLEKLYQSAVMQKADMVACNLRVWENDGTNKIRLNLTDKIVDLDKDNDKALMDFLRFKYDYANWNKLYSAEIICKNDLYFKENMLVYEDLLFNLCYIQFARKLSVLQTPLYNYRVHNHSVMRSASETIVEDNNLLYMEFNSFCNDHCSDHLRQLFNKQMRSFAFYTIIPKLEKKNHDQTGSFFSVISKFSKKLSKFDEGFFRYNTEELVGLQGMKKRILRRKQFLLFSILIFLRRKWPG